MDAQDELLFLPLGGAGEIGMNLNMFGYGGQVGHSRFGNNLCWA